MPSLYVKRGSYRLWEIRTVGRQAHEVDVPLNRDVFTRTLIRELAGTLEDVVGIEEASGYISVVGASIGEQINQSYRSALQVPRLSRDQVRDVLVDLKRRIEGDFFVIEENEDRIVLGNRKCPFAEKVVGRRSMCMMTSNVFGHITAENLGYSKVELRETIAEGAPECRVIVYLNPTAEAAGGAGARIRRSGPGAADLTDPVIACEHVLFWTKSIEGWSQWCRTRKRSSTRSPIASCWSNPTEPRFMPTPPPAGHCSAIPAAIAGQSLHDLIEDPENLASVYLRRCAASLQPVPGTLAVRLAGASVAELRCEGARLRLGDGSPGPILLRCRPKREAVSQFTILSEKIADLTREIVARRAAEEALRDSERQFRMLVNSIPTLAWMAQAGWLDRLVQPALVRIYRHDPRRDGGVGLAVGARSGHAARRVGKLAAFDRHRPSRSRWFFRCAAPTGCFVRS